MPGFNIVAQVQLQGPTNIAAVAQQISSGLSNISANVNVNVNNASLGALQGLGNTIGQLNTSLGALVNASNTASGAVSNLGGSMSRTSAGASVVQQSARTATTSLKGVTTAFQEAEAAGEQFGKSAGLALRRFAGFTLAAGTVFAVVDSFKHGIEQAILFEREMNKLEQVNAGTVTQIKEVERAISSLSTTFGTSSQSLSQAAVLLGSAGLKADDVTKSLEALAKSAASPQFGNLIDTTNGVIAIMSQFKVPASEIEKSLGAINSVSNAFSTESGDLIEAIKRSGGAFRATGGDLNEFLALFTSVRATTRESAESIATGLRTIFTRFQTPQTVNALKEMGINLRFSRTEAEQLGKVNLTDQFVGPYEAVRRLSTALKDLPTTDPRFSAIIDQLGGYRQISRVIPLIQEFGTAQRAYATAQSGALSITAASEKAQESYAVQIAKTKETFLELTRTIVGSEGFRVFLDGLLKIANAAVILLNALGPLIPLLTTLAAIRIGAAIPGFIAGFVGGFRGEQPKRLAIGGVVPGVGNTDTVPAMLTPGEFVVRKESAQRIGYSNLSKLNSGGQVKVKDGVQYLAEGGIAVDIDGSYGGLFLRGKGSTKDYSAYSAGSISSKKLEKILDNDSLRKRIRGELHLIRPQGQELGLNLTVGNEGYKINDILANGATVADVPVKFAGSPGVHLIDPNAARNFNTIIEQGVRTAVITSTRTVLDSAGIKSDNSTVAAFKAMKENGLDSVIGHAFEATLVGIAGSVGERTTPGEYFDFKNVDSKTIQGLSQLFSNVNESYLDVKSTASSGNIRSLVGKAINTLSEGSSDFSLSYNRARSENVPALIREIETNTNNTRKRLQSKAPPVKLARGGVVPGVGDTDSVPAQLMPGEFVIRKSSAQKIGYEALSSLNNFGGQIRKFEQGGSVFDKDVSDQNIKKVTDFFNKLGLSGIDLNKLISRLYFVDKVPSKYGNDPYGKFDLNSRAVLIKAPSYTAKGELVKEGADYETLGHEIFGHALSLKVANLNKSARLPTSDPSTLLGEVAAQSKDHLYPLVKNKEYRQKEAEKYQKAGFPDLVLDEAFANAMQTYVRLLAVKKGEVPLDNQLKSILTDPKAYSVLYRVHNEIIPLLKQVTSEESPALNVNLSKLKDTHDQVKGQFLGIGKKFFASGGPVLMAGGGEAKGKFKQIALELAGALGIFTGGINVDDLAEYLERSKSQVVAGSIEQEKRRRATPPKSPGYALGGRVRMAFGGGPTFSYGKKKESLTYSELEALGLGKEDLEEFKKIGEGQLTEVSKIDENKKERKLKTLQLPLFPTERFAMIYRGDASTAGLDRVHFSSRKGLSKLSGPAERFLSDYGKLPPDGPVEGIRARFDKHVFSEKAASDFEVRIKLKVRSYLNNLFKEEFPSSQLSLNVKDKTMQDITGGLFETYVSGLSQIPTAGKNETFDIKDARIQVSEINKVLYPKLQTGLADIKSSGGDNNITSMIGKILNYEVAQGGNKAIDTARIGLAPGEVLAPPLSFKQQRLKDLTESFASVGLPLPQRYKDLYGKAKGGEVDSVPALLTPGEFVINRESASRIGLSELNRMNVTGKTGGGLIQRFADGGLVQKILDLISGNNPASIAKEDIAVKAEEARQAANLQRGLYHTDTEFQPLAGNKIPEVQAALAAVVNTRAAKLGARAQTEEGLGGTTVPGSRLEQIETKLHREMIAGGVDPTIAAQEAKSRAEEYRNAELRNKAEQELIKETVAMAVVRRDEHNKILSTSYQLVSKREVAEAELARQAEELKSKGKDRFGGFASADAQREIASRGGAARLSTTSINEINTGAQTRLAQELVQSEVARIRGLKLGIKSDEIERLARENVTNALLLERKVITDGVTGKRKLEDSENLATAKNLELARETDHLTNQQKQTELAQKGVGGAVSGLQGEIRPGIGDRLKSFLTNPAALAGIAYSATAYAPGLINQAQGGSFEERLPGQVGPRGEVRGDLRERGVAAVGAAGTGLAAGFGAAALGSTLATAGVIGAAAVPPIAIIAGVVAGLLTFTQSLHEQEKQIRSAQLGKALDSLALKINDFNSGKLFGGEAGFSVVGREFQNTERLRRAEDTTSRGYAFGLFTDNTPQKVTATEEKSLREKVLPQLPGLLQAQEKVLGDIFTRQNAENIRGGVSLNPNELKGQVESVLADFLKAGDGFGKQILETTARLKNVPYAEVERETKQQIIAIQNSARVVTNELQARALLSSQLNSLVTFTNSLNGAIIALKEFDDKLSLTGQIVSGNVTGGQVNVRGDVTQAVQSADTDTLNKVLTESLGVLGSRLDTLRTPITELNRANRELPGILAQAGSTPRGPLEPGTFGDRVTTLLQNASFGREITTAITSALDTQFKDPAALQQALTRDIGGLSKQLVKEYQPLLDAVANISKSVQDETNKFIGSLSQSSRFLEEINANLQQGATLSLQYSRTTAENQAIRAGRRGDAGSFVSLQQLESPYNQLQQRLAPNVANPFDAGAITRQLDKVNEGLRRQDEIRRTSIGTTAGDKAAQQFEKLAFESNNLQKALKNLADVSSRAAGIQEKLGQLQQDRESRLSFGERFITSDAAGQGQIQRGLALINLTAQTKSAEGLTDPDRRLLFETLHSLGNARLPAAGNITAKDFSEQLVESFGGGIFKPQIGDQQKELDLRQTLIQYFDAARQSNEALVNKESEGYDKFIQDLTRAHTIFLTKLEQIELQTVQATLQRQKEQADVEKGLATSQKTARDEIRDKTGIGGLSTDDQKNFVGALLKNQDEIRKLNDLQSVKGGNFRPDTVVNDIRKSLDTRNIDADIRGTKQLVTGRTFYQVDQGDLTNRITSLVEKNISSLGLSQKYIPQITAAAQKQVGDISGFSKSEVQESYTEALNNLPRIIVDLKEVEEARSQQIRDYNTLESKLIENLSSGKPELKESAQAALKNFPQIAPALSQFQSGEQFGKITDRLDKASNAVEGFETKLKDVTKNLDNLNTKLSGGTTRSTTTVPLLGAGLFPGRASGGIISGAQSSSVLAHGTDTVPAMLTPGEFVVRREAVSKHLPLLLAINDGRMSGEDHGGISHFQLGGLVDRVRYNQALNELRQAVLIGNRYRYATSVQAQLQFAATPQAQFAAVRQQNLAQQATLFPGTTEIEDLNHNNNARETLGVDSISDLDDAYEKAKQLLFDLAVSRRKAFAPEIERLSLLATIGRRSGRATASEQRAKLLDAIETPISQLRDAKADNPDSKYALINLLPTKLFDQLKSKILERKNLQKQLAGYDPKQLQQEYKDKALPYIKGILDETNRDIVNTQLVLSGKSSIKLNEGNINLANQNLINSQNILKKYSNTALYPLDDNVIKIAGPAILKSVLKEAQLNLSPRATVPLLAYAVGTTQAEKERTDLIEGPRLPSASRVAQEGRAIEVRADEYLAEQALKYKYVEPKEGEIEDPRVALKSTLVSLKDIRDKIRKLTSERNELRSIASDLESKKNQAKDLGQTTTVTNIESELGKSFSQVRQEKRDDLTAVQSKLSDFLINKPQRTGKLADVEGFEASLVEFNKSKEPYQKVVDEKRKEYQEFTIDKYFDSLQKDDNAKPVQIYPKIEFANEAIRQAQVELLQKQEDLRKQGIRRPERFAFGGIVSGVGNTDTVPAMLTPGEFVLNRAATSAVGVSNLNKINYMQTGGVVTGGANTGGSLLSSDAIASISNFSGVATGLSRALTTFNGSSEGLTSALNAFPKTITGTFTHNVNVNHNGLEILNTLTPSISEIALRTVNRILGNYIRQNLPGAPALNEETP